MAFILPKHELNTEAQDKAKIKRACVIPIAPLFLQPIPSNAQKLMPVLNVVLRESVATRNR